MKKLLFWIVSIPLILACEKQETRIDTKSETVINASFTTECSNKTLLFPIYKDSWWLYEFQNTSITYDPQGLELSRNTGSPYRDTIKVLKIETQNSDTIYTLNRGFQPSFNREIKVKKNLGTLEWITEENELYTLPISVNLFDPTFNYTDRFFSQFTTMRKFSNNQLIKNGKTEDSLFQATQYHDVSFTGGKNDTRHLRRDTIKTHPCKGVLYASEHEGFRPSHIRTMTLLDFHLKI